ncbi:MAG: nitrate reductase molybdenum cofactor assembly chaperone [Actinobacteria bacterium]|nr:nitrate reductase molybdenum cofactor assembly chaperone [Actinomycetota bacterium]
MRLRTRTPGVDTRGRVNVAAPTADETRAAHACASWLISYPDDALIDRLDQIVGLARGLPEQLRVPLAGTVEVLAATDRIALAEAYVDTFDTRRRGCLYLTYYSNGDTRRRGMALIAIRQAYLAAGLVPRSDELPDHLAVVLEFSASTSLEAGLGILSDNRAGIELLRRHLASIDSPWQGAIDAVCATLAPMTDAEVEAMFTLAATGPEAEMVGLDGYGTDSDFDHIYPASRPGPSFCGDSAGSGGRDVDGRRRIPVKEARS